MNQLTFTEEELKEAGKWLTFVHKQAKWSGKESGSMTGEEVQEVARFFNWCHKHLKKIEDNIFEIKKVISAEETKAE